MGKNQKSVDGVIEKLALITDGIQTLFPNGKSFIVFELNYEDFKKVQSNFRHIDSGFNQFKIDLSGIEVVFILENTIKMEEPVKINIFGKLKSFISGKLTVKD